MVRINKRGQDLSIGTLILIVLGVIVLVLLILGFSIGWGNLWEKINIFGGGNSIGDVATACSLAASSNNKFDYCENFRKIKIDGKTEYVNCQDTRVGSESGITCDQKIISNQCEKLAKDAANSKTLPEERKTACQEILTKTIINSNACISHLTDQNYCVSLSSEQSCHAPESSVCASKPQNDCNGACKFVSNKCLPDEDYCKTKDKSSCTTDSSCVLR